jgi:hypothetical protein
MTGFAAKLGRSYFEILLGTSSSKVAHKLQYQVFFQGRISATGLFHHPALNAYAHMAGASHDGAAADLETTFPQFRRYSEFSLDRK